MKARLIQRKDRGFHAYIDTEDVYEGVKSGKLSWDEHNKSKITHYVVPASVFERLMALDKEKDSIKEDDNASND